MRHKISGRRLNRTSSHREAMFRNMAASLICHEQIRTTLPKAKELRRVAEPLITMAKKESVANRRLAFARLRDKAAVGKLFTLGARFKERPGGYVRILKSGFRAGDNAPMAIVQLVEMVKAEEMEAPAKTKKIVKKQAAPKSTDVTAQEAEGAEEDAEQKQAAKKKAAKKAPAKKATAKKAAAKKTTTKKTAKKKTTKKKSS